MDALERLQQTPLPFATLLGVRFTSAASERVTAELTVRDDLCTSPAVLHSGAITAFADTLGAAATILILAPASGTTTIESKTNFVAPAQWAPQFAARRRRCIAGGARWSDKPASPPRQAAWSLW